MRAFVAVDLGEEANRRFAGLQAQLRARMRGVSWARAHDVHITLAFFDDLADLQLENVTAAMRSAATVEMAPRLRLSGTGSFPNDRRPRVLWCGIEDEAGRMANVRAALASALRDGGVSFDDKPFSPHATLGRIRRVLSADALAVWHEMAAQPFSSDWWTPQRLVLFESRGGYRPVTSVPLATQPT